MSGGLDGRPYYGRARIVAGLILIGLVVVLSIIDAFRPDYQLDSIQLALMLGTGLTLLGVEAGLKLLDRS